MLIMVLSRYGYIFLLLYAFLNLSNFLIIIDMCYCIVGGGCKIAHTCYYQKIVHLPKEALRLVVS